MTEEQFRTVFAALTGNDNGHFPWQWALYQRFEKGDFPPSCNLPTGLGKTSVIALWLIALANTLTRVPRRLVYVVNRRTVVDQSTEEAKKLRDNLPRVLEIQAKLGSLAISTLRGQFADNREWSADPSLPAVIVGTVDMIGSRLLFSGYGIGFKSKPLHAGFLGQDVLLVHDEAHLEPAFQKLIEDIQDEQKKESAPLGEQLRLKVMELSATSRGEGETFKLEKPDYAHPEVRKRIEAKKTVHFHENKDQRKLADEIAERALSYKDSGRAVLVFVRRVDDVEKIAAKLRKEKQKTQQLTGTIRGLERDQLVRDPIFTRFLPPSSRSTGEIPTEGTVYLVCTSAGEVGVNISADHLVCDLSTFESMAQRFGRVNRFGDRDDTRIDLVYPKEFDDENELGSRLRKTLDLLKQMNGDGSPKALGSLDASARLEAFAPSPTFLPVSDILFDAWALTTIRGKLPGRPPVEPYLHGLTSELPETHVVWREEVGVITGDLLAEYKPEDLLDDYPLKPHELLRDNSSRVYDRLENLTAPPDTPVWILSEDDSVKVTSLGELIESGKDALNYKTVVLTPAAGGLEKGMLTAGSTIADDVADQWLDEKGQRRVRGWDDDPEFDAKAKGMRLVRRLDFSAGEEDENGQGRSWHWFERPNAADNEGSKSSQRAVSWDVHTKDVTDNATRISEALQLQDDLRQAVILAAKFHDLGKKRELWQRSIGHRLPPIPKPEDWLAKSGKGMKPLEITDYRHEFGSLLDVQKELEFQKQSEDMKDLILHLIAVHHGRGRPHFAPDEAFDPKPNGQDVSALAALVPRRFARLQRKYGRWGLAYLESLLRAADYAASANPSAFVEARK